MDIKFPVFVLAKDCGEMYRCDSIDQMQCHFEEIDIKNGEYGAWDRDGLPLELKVQKPTWLKIDPQGELQPEQLIEALRKYAKASGAKIEIEGRADFEKCFEQIDNHNKGKKAAKGFWHRVFRRDKCE